MICPNLSPALPRLSLCWIFLPITLLGSVPVPTEKWDEALGRLNQNGGCSWESDPPVTGGDAPALQWKKKRPTSNARRPTPKGKKKGDWTATLREFERTVKNVLTDLDIRTLSDPEFNNKERPRVLIGIRCAPLHYPLTIEGGAFGFGGQQVYEVTQFYIQLIETTPGVAQFRVLRRSARHLPQSLALQPLGQPPIGRRTALTIMERLGTALSNLRNPP